jgi:hypothetical protein
VSEWQFNGGQQRDRHRSALHHSTADTDTDTNADTNADADTYANADADTYADSIPGARAA